MLRPESSINEITFPLQSFITQNEMRLFQTLHEAINLVHLSGGQEGQQTCRYGLRSFDGKDIHLFKCLKQGCQSFILIRNKKTNLKENGNNITKILFQYQKFGNLHWHIEKQKQMNFTDIQAQLYAVNHEADQKYHQKLDILEHIKQSLRKHQISFYFRDFLNCFMVTEKNSSNNRLENYLPYHLPEILRSAPIEVSFRLGMKCVNEKKKTYLYLVEVYALEEIVTELKFIACNKTKNPQLYLYTVVLIYITLNRLKNCLIFMNSQVLEETAYTLSTNNHQLLALSQPQTVNFIEFIKQIQRDFLIINDHNNQQLTLNSQIRDYNSENRCQIIYKQKIPLKNKTQVSIQELQKKQMNKLKNKMLAAEQIYKSMTSQHTQWRVNEQKPSIIRRLNELMSRQQKDRVKKDRIKQAVITSMAEDCNIVDLIQLQQNQEIVQRDIDRVRSQKQRQNEYLKHVLQQIQGDNFLLMNIEK